MKMKDKDNYGEKYYTRKIINTKFINNRVYNLVLETYFNKDYLKVLIEEKDKIVTYTNTEMLVKQRDEVIWSKDMNAISYTSETKSLRRKILIKLAEEFFEELNKDNIADIDSIGIIDNSDSKDNKGGENGESV